MYYVKKTLEIAGSHFLCLPYESKCSGMHGHNWIITVYCKSEVLENGMVADFSNIKKEVMKLDHLCLNDILKQPTAENIAKMLCDNISKCYRVEVQESSGNMATYTEEEPCNTR